MLLIAIDFINQFFSKRRLYSSANRKKLMNTISSIPVATKYIIERLKILPDLDSKVSEIIACSNNVKTFHVIQTSEGLDFTRKPNFRNLISKLLKCSERNIAKFGGKSKWNIKEYYVVRLMRDL